MSEVKQESGGVQVWDLPVRVFHWLLVAMLVFQYVTYQASKMTWHMYGGYVIIALVVFRIIWGLVGSTNARFWNFLYGPGAMLAYVKTLPSRQASRFAGHNPLGGWSVLLMLALLVVQGVTGLYANDDAMLEGPLVRLVSKEMSDTLTTIHRYNIYVLLAVAAVHVLAVLYYLSYKSENLVKAMFTGRKEVAPGQTAGRIAGTGLALVVMAVSAVAVYLLVTWK